MNKQFKCSDFICSDPKSCPEWSNGLCSGKSNDRFSNCGCDACKFHRLVGPYMTRKKEPDISYSFPKSLKQMHEYNIDSNDWIECEEEDCDFIANP